ncbi:MAG: hypothetical protein RMK51_04470 [Meiothermus sp.]|uniref:hypothetical protein n=1 Tax=Meiothermus sp. TaxID=1955249 RepID=UPI0025E0E25C|nr:hypothetical protein [Meiothermus sp.]MCS7067800.1 hypothetical protein [Meiothermus sp.]MDW8425166.1 hypothetical protein [Meiothermus sp.]
MIQTIFANLPAMLFTLALGAALLGLLFWALALQGAASKRTAQFLWGLAVGLALIGLIRAMAGP